MHSDGEVLDSMELDGGAHPAPSDELSGDDVPSDGDGESAGAVGSLRFGADPDDRAIRRGTKKGAVGRRGARDAAAQPLSAAEDAAQSTANAMYDTAEHLLQNIKDMPTVCADACL